MAETTYIKYISTGLLVGTVYKNPLSTKNVKQPNQELKFKNLSYSDMKKQISSMKNSATTGKANISMSMLKKLGEPFSNIMTVLYNLIIKKGKYPTLLKTNKVIPIPKSNLKMDPTNYRPINLVEPISKIIEKILNNQITKFTHKNKLIPETMQGSVKNRSSALLTSDLLHQLKISVKNFQTVAVVCLDQSAFYDVIDL